MRKRVFGRKLNRNTKQRKWLFRNLMVELVMHGRIKTTEAKAKAIKGEIERLVTKAIKREEAARNHITKALANTEAVQKLMGNVASRFVGRPGGYTRIIRIGERVKDAAPLVFIEWVVGEIESSKPALIESGSKVESEKTIKIESQKEQKTKKASERKAKTVQAKSKTKKKV